MIDVQEWVRGNKGPFSFDNLRLTFIQPRLYFAKNIADFIEDVDYVEVTPPKLFGNNKYVGSAIILIPNCTYDAEHSSLDRDGLEKALSKYFFEDTSEEERGDIEEYLDTLPSAVLTDMTGELNVRSKYVIEHGQRLLASYLAYKPGIDYLYLIGHQISGPEQGERDASIEFMANLVPDMA